MNNPACFKIVASRHNYNWQDYVCPIDWVEKLAEIFYAYNFDADNQPYVKWCETAPSKGDILTQLNRQLALDPFVEEPSSPIKKIRKKLPKIYAIISQEVVIESFNYQLSHNTIITQEILEGLFACTDGFIERLYNIWQRFEFNYKLEEMLHAIRKDIIERCARGFFQYDRISSAMEVHVLNKYFSEAKKHNYGIEAGEGTNVSDSQEFINRISRSIYTHYRPLLIIKEIEERLIGKLRELGYGVNSPYSYDIVESWIKYLNLFFEKIENSNGYNLYCYCIVDDDDNITELNKPYIRDRIVEFLISKNIFSHANTSSDLIKNLIIFEEINLYELEYYFNINGKFPEPQQEILKFIFKKNAKQQNILMESIEQNSVAELIAVINHLDDVEGFEIIQELFLYHDKACSNALLQAVQKSSRELDLLLRLFLQFPKSIQNQILNPRRISPGSVFLEIQNYFFKPNNYWDILLNKMHWPSIYTTMKNIGMPENYRRNLAIRIETLDFSKCSMNDYDAIMGIILQMPDSYLYNKLLLLTVHHKPNLLSKLLDKIQEYPPKDLNNYILELFKEDIEDNNALHYAAEHCAQFVPDIIKFLGLIDDRLIQIDILKMALFYENDLGWCALLFLAYKNFDFFLNILQLLKDLSVDEETICRVLTIKNALGYDVLLLSVLNNPEAVKHIFDLLRMLPKATMEKTLEKMVLQYEYDDKNSALIFAARTNQGVFKYILNFIANNVGREKKNEILVKILKHKSSFSSNVLMVGARYISDIVLHIHSHILNFANWQEFSETYLVACNKYNENALMIAARHNNCSLTYLLNWINQLDNKEAVIKQIFCQRNNALDNILQVALKNQQAGVKILFNFLGTSCTEDFRNNLLSKILFQKNKDKKTVIDIAQEKEIDLSECFELCDYDLMRQILSYSR